VQIEVDRIIKHLHALRCT